MEEDGEETVLYYERDEGDELEGHAGEAHRDEEGDWAGPFGSGQQRVAWSWHSPGAVLERLRRGRWSAGNAG